MMECLALIGNNDYNFEGVNLIHGVDERGYFVKDQADVIY